MSRQPRQSMDFSAHKQIWVTKATDVAEKKCNKHINKTKKTKNKNKTHPVFGKEKRLAKCLEWNLLYIILSKLISLEVLLTQNN